MGGQDREGGGQGKGDSSPTGGGGGAVGDRGGWGLSS